MECTTWSAHPNSQALLPRPPALTFFPGHCTNQQRSLPSLLASSSASSLPGLSLSVAKMILNLPFISSTLGNNTSPSRSRRPPPPPPPPVSPSPSSAPPPNPGLDPDPANAPDPNPDPDPDADEAPPRGVRALGRFAPSGTLTTFQ